MAKTLDTLLLLALPASGKSEVRKYLATRTPRECREDFHLGPTVQLDDYPYVHLMRRIDDELADAGAPRVFFPSPERGFTDGREWQTLIELLNEDHADLLCGRTLGRARAGAALLDRIDGARVRQGLPPALSRLGRPLRARLEERLAREARAAYGEREGGYVDSLEGHTLVVEFARGGPEGASMPLPAGYGYASSLACLSPALLERAAILYIWVTPEESRRKNRARANPHDPGSILHHGVPEEVMRGEYGCDDLDHLLATSGAPDHVRVRAHGREYLLPVARFDNRVDKTSFIRDEPAQWKAADVAALHGGLKEALARLATLRK